ncbi:MAG: hypothetical protein Roseis2KO_38900 [Roseivirga sp.]
MKRLSIALTMLLAVTFSACNSDDVIPEDCFEVKLVESYCTGNAVLQIITPAAQAFGETWTSARGTTYENVFSTFLPCGFDYDAFGDGQTFSIKLSDRMDETVDCVRCMMLVSGLPETFSFMHVDSNCNKTD